ncbi:hypothetical protein [Candidatus Phycosocius spiralis]|uniref:Uncharacterized protein n=1 Tax=Candidatus Phycosocius spiralis TaxID=2815099 RepID=A0ABQ4PXZ0_9PROT|nr:hypothetical protein [Candidatus Phycosocius spiralis]GIU67872.1 hypothetical protein PsB1_2026 [Candidatus Phycosocius spiralis]
MAETNRDRSTGETKIVDEEYLLMELDMKEFVFSVGLWIFFIGISMFVSRTQAEAIETMKYHIIPSHHEIVETYPLFESQTQQPQS